MITMFSRLFNLGFPPRYVTSQVQAIEREISLTQEELRHLGSVEHELRQSLQSLLENAMLMRHRDGEEQGKYLEATRQVGEHMRVVLDGLGSTLRSHARELDRTRSLRILVVGDSTLMRGILGAILRHEGHIVVETDNGREAVRCVTHEAFDLVLMDQRMPGMSGLMTAREIRNLSGVCGSTPICLVTSETVDQDSPAFVESGVNWYLRKPCQPAELMVIVAAAAQYCRSGQGSEESHGAPLTVIQEAEIVPA